MDILHPIIHEDMLQILQSARKEIMKLEGKEILITGASGMIAKYIISALIYANDTLLKRKIHLYLVTRHGNKIFGKKEYIHYSFR